MDNVKDGTNFKFNVDNWKKILSGQYKLKNLIFIITQIRINNWYILLFL